MRGEGAEAYGHDAHSCPWWEEVRSECTAGLIGRQVLVGALDPEGKTPGL